MPYTAAAIANYFLELAEHSGEQLTPMKLQRLVYFAHGWSLAIHEQNLIDEQIEAWRYGPVIRSLHKDLKRYGSDPVTARIQKVRRRVALPSGSASFDDLDLHSELYTPSLDIEDSQTRNLLDQIWSVYGNYTGIQLSNMTHEPDSPWSLLMQEYSGSPPRGTDIPRSSIRNYFESMATRE